MSEWIAVKDRLPDEDVEVLYWDGNYFGIGRIVWWEGENNQIPVFLGDSGMTNRGVIYWMPLPKPPEGA